MRFVARCITLVVLLVAWSCGDSGTPPVADAPEVPRDVPPPPMEVQPDQSVFFDSPPDLGPPLGPRLAFEPASLHFATCAPGAVQVLTVELENDGDEDATISHYQLRNAGGTFVVRVGEPPVSLEPTPTTVDGAALPEALTVAPGESVRVEVHCEAQPDTQAAGFLRLRAASEGEGAPEWIELSFSWTRDSPALTVSPEEVDFGRTWVGQRREQTLEITSTGGEILRLKSFDIKADSSFSVLVNGAEPPSPSTPPVLLRPGETTSVTVSYRPRLKSPPGAGGQPEREVVVMFVHHNAPPLNSTPVRLSGYAEVTQEPIAIIECRQGTEVAVGTKLDLIGSNSLAPEGFKIAQYRFSVEAPEGACPDKANPNECFEPHRSLATPSFVVDVAGEYVFSLVVWDDHEAHPMASDPAELLVIAH